MIVGICGGTKEDICATVTKCRNIFVQCAVNGFMITAAKTGSIAPRAAIKTGGWKMSEREYYDNIFHYKNAVYQAQILLSRGVILPKEYAIIDTKLRQKYGLNSCSIFSENDLIINDYRVNIPLTEEVE